jgi:hypothetical protein
MATNIHDIIDTATDPVEALMIPARTIASELTPKLVKWALRYLDHARNSHNSPCKH